MSYWNYVVLLLSVLLCAWLILSATRRSNRANLIARIIAGTGAAAALALMAFTFYYESSGEQRTSGGEAVIATEGTTKDSLQPFIKKGIPVYTLDPAIGSDKSLGASWVRSLSDISNAGTFHITGFGLEEDQLKSLEKYVLEFHPPVLNNNFQAISWPQRLNSGDEFNIQGRFNNNNNTNKPVKIILEGFGTHLDSLMIAAGQSSKFSLSTIPKQNGRAVYTLTVRIGEKIVLQQKIPFEVTLADPLKILVLSASPDFENKFLKNWLFTHHYSIAVRNSISKNKFSRELLNMEDLNTATINTTLLAKFDLVIADATTLASLPSSQQNDLRNSIEQQGLGLIIRADSITSTSLFYNQPFRLNQSPASNKLQIGFQMRDTNQSLPALVVERPLLITASQKIRTMLHDKEGRLFAASTVYGNGKLLYTTVNNSFSWVLGGDTIAYRQFWSNLISEVARKKVSGERYTSTPALVVTDMPATLRIESPDTIPFATAVNKTAMPLQQDFNLPFQWEGTYWPRKAGWQHAQKRDNQYFNWYAFTESDWKDVRASNKIRLNELYTAKAVRSAKKNTAALTTISKEIPKISFFIIFLICCSYLWIEEKFYNSRL